MANGRVVKVARKEETSIEELPELLVTHQGRARAVGAALRAPALRVVVCTYR